MKEPTGSIGQIYICKEDLPICSDYYGRKFDFGTAKKGRKFKLIDLPDAAKKKYTLREIPVGNYEPYELYLRESVFKEYFELCEED